MAVTKPSITDFRAKFTEFPETLKPNEDVQDALDVAFQLWDLSRLGVLYLAAHILVLDSERYASGTVQPDGGSGLVTSETIGPQRIDYKTQAENGDDVFYARTSYGRLFLSLKRRTPAYAGSFRIMGRKPYLA